MNVRGLDRETLRRMKDVSKSHRDAWNKIKHHCMTCGNAINMKKDYMFFQDGLYCSNGCKAQKLGWHDYGPCLFIGIGSGYYNGLQWHWCKQRKWKDVPEAQKMFKAFERDYL